MLFTSFRPLSFRRPLPATAGKLAITLIVCPSRKPLTAVMALPIDIRAAIDCSHTRDPPSHDCNPNTPTQGF
jgi:hypothetical protein